MTTISTLAGRWNKPSLTGRKWSPCVDDDLSSDYNEREYQNIRVNYEMLVDRGANREAVEFMDFPAHHKQYRHVWCGMDVGLTNHPTEILVFAEVKKADVPP